VVTGIASGGVVKDAFKLFKEVLNEYFKHMEQSIHPCSLVGICDQVHWSLPKKLGTILLPGELVLLAGSEGIGKTFLAVQVAIDIASQGGRVLYLSPIVPNHILLKIAMAQHSRIPLSDLSAGTLEDEQWVQLYEAACRLEKIPCIFNDSRDVTLEGIAASCSAANAEQQLALIVIDARSLPRETSTASGPVFKGLAEQLNSPILVLSSLPLPGAGQLEDMHCHIPAGVDSLVTLHSFNHGTVSAQIRSRHGVTRDDMAISRVCGNTGTWGAIVAWKSQLKAPDSVQ